MLALNVIRLHLALQNKMNKIQALIRKIGFIRCIFMGHDPSDEEIERMDMANALINTTCIWCNMPIGIEPNPEDPNSFYVSWL
jgi:hypothetical protein